MIYTIATITALLALFVMDYLGGDRNDMSTDWTRDRK